MPQAFYILFGAGFTVAVCVSLGRLLLQRSGVELYRQEENPLGFLLGAAMLSLVVFSLAAAHLVYKGVFLLAGVLIIAAAVRARAFQPSAKALAPLPKPWRWLFGVIFALFCVVYLSNSMAPEWSPDGATYHLGLVARYYREHGFPRITNHMYANLSQGVELLFLFAFAFGRHSAAATVHFAFLIALTLGILAYGRRQGHPAAGAAAALFVFLSPMVGVDGTSAYNDVAMACTLFGLFHLLEVWRESRHPGLLIPIGVVAGFAYAVKYTAFLGMPYALGVVAWTLWRSGKPLLRPLILTAACAFPMVAPWMVKNWLVVQNPVSPLFNSVFPNPYVHISFEKEWSGFLRTYDLPDRRAIPLETTVRGEALGGILGPLFLLAPLALLSLRTPLGRRILLPAALFSLPYAANIGTRFLIPPLPFWSLAMALAMERWRAVLPVLVAAHALAAWPPNIKRYSEPWTWRIRHVPWKAALRIEDEDLYLRDKTADYVVARLIEQHVPHGQKVFSFSPVMEAYTSREVLIAYYSAENERLQAILQTPLVPELQPSRRPVFSFPARTVRRLRVVQDAGGEPDIWSITEFRVYHNGAELPRNPNWRIKAWPMPWEVPLAFDNNPMTRWRAWQAVEPGMFVEVDFGRDETADTVALQITDDQWKTKVHLELTDGEGTTVRLPDPPRETSAPVPPRLRRYAVAELKANAIQYILVGPSVFGAADFQTKQPVWGITQVGERYGYRLYHLD